MYSLSDFTTITTGEVVTFKLYSNDLFRGTVLFSKKDSITLSKVLNLSKQAKYPDIKLEPETILTLIRSEISSIISRDNIAINTGPDKNEENKKCENWDMLPNTEIDYFHISSYDTEYDAAFAHLKHAENIGVVALGSTTSDVCSILALSTRNNIFIYDIQNFVTIPKDLCSLLQDEHVVKVVHNYKSMKNILHTHCNNIFDLQIAAQILHLLDDSNTLSSLVNKLQAIPDTVLVKAEARNPHKWCKRPLEESHLEQINCLTRYLISVMHLLKRRMLADFYEKTKNVLRQDIGSMMMVKSNKMK